MSSIFLSYSSADVKLATRVERALKRHGYPVFRDKDPDRGIPGGTRFADELFLNIDLAGIVVFLATPTSLESRWCHTELAVAVARQKYVVQISTEKVKVHPVLTSMHAIGPIADVKELIDKLVFDLARVGLVPRQSEEWDPNRSPYPGLERLTEDHAAVLFGREREIGLVLDRLDRPQPPPLLVVGPSGSGKSSLVRAGVVPQLKRRANTTVLPVIDAGADPLQTIAVELERIEPKNDAQRLVDDARAFTLAIDRLAAASDGGRVVLVLDQAEDMVARTAVRAHVIELVNRLKATDRDRLAVIVILRSASLDPWMRDAEVGSLTPGDPVQVLPLDRAGLRDVIVGPARLAHIRIESEGLVEKILDDTQQGYALPLLAALLQEMTKDHSRTHPAEITAKAYEAFGPVSSVIAHRAQAAVDDIGTKLKVPETSVVDAYLRFVEVDEDGQIVRTELDADALPADVVSIFGVMEEYRLVIRDRVAVPAPVAPAMPSAIATREVLMAVHEEVFRAWPALKSTIAARIADLQIRTWVRHDAEEWLTSDRGHIAIAGGRLDLALDWSRRNPRDVTPEVRKFLDAAVSQRRLGRVARIAIAGLAGVVLVVGAFAYQAIQARNDAEASRLATEARANFGSRRDLGLLLALEARARSGDPQIQAMPLVGLTQGPGPIRFERPLGITFIDSAGLDAAGTRAVLLGSDGVALWDVASHRVVGELPGAAALVGISKDGSTVATWRQTTEGAGTIDIARWPDTAITRRCDLDGEADILGVSPDGTFIVAISADSTGRQTTRTLATADCTGSTLDEVDGNIVDLAVGSDGIALALDDAGAAIWEPVSGDVQSLPSDESVTTVAWGDRGELGGTSSTGNLLVWDTTTIDPEPLIVAVFDADVAGVRLAPVPEQSAWVVSSDVGDLRVLQTSPRLAMLSSSRSLPAIGSEGPDGAGEAFEESDGTAGALALAVTETGVITIDGRARLVTWDRVSSPPLGEQVFAGGRVDRFRALPDGSLVAGGPDGVWLLDDVGNIRDHRETAAVTAIAPGKDGWAIGLVSGEVLRTSGSVQSLVPVATVPGPVRALAFLDSGTIAIADTAGAVTIVPGSGASQPLSFQVPIHSLGSSGGRLIAGADNGDVYTVDLTADPFLIRKEELPSSLVPEVSALEVSPDGGTLAIGGDGGTILVATIRSDGSIGVRDDLTGHTDRVNTLSISPDGHWLASSGEDGHVILWNVDTGQRVGDPIPVAREPVLAFGGTGDRQLFLSDDRGGLVRWDMRPESWVRIACDLIGNRVLTQEERNLYLGGSAPAATCPDR